MLLALESTDQRMEHLALGEIYHGRVLSAAELAARVDAVTNDQVVALAARLFVPEACAVVLLGKSQGAPLDAGVLGALA